jgi:hypothetical protein
MPVTVIVEAVKNRSSVAVALILLVLGAGIAAEAPWGIAMGTALGHSPALRACLLLGLGVTGLFFARRTGLEIDSTGLRHPARVAFLIGAAVAAYVLVLDGLVFRSMLPPDYRTFIVTTGLVVRLFYFIARGINENIIYRLFLGSALVWVIGLAWRRTDGRIASGAYWLAMVLAQLINIYINVIPTAVAPVTPLVLTYDILRYVAPGVLWGLLYWRYGFFTAVLVHSATHIFLQPLLRIALS